MVCVHTIALHGCRTILTVYVHQHHTTAVQRSLQQCKHVVATNVQTVSTAGLWVGKHTAGVSDQFLGGVSVCAQSVPDSLLSLLP